MCQGCDQELDHTHLLETTLIIMRVYGHLFWGVRPDWRLGESVFLCKLCECLLVGSWGLSKSIQLDPLWILT